MSKSKRDKARPYVDRGEPGTLRYQRGGVLPLVRDPPPVDVRRLMLDAIRRHNSLDPELHETHRILLRWSESLGSGLPNPDADTRETHFDPLPPDLAGRVTGIVDDSPWAHFVRKIYMATVTGKSLAEELGMSRTQFYAARSSALWYLRGRFEAAGVHG